MTYILGVSAVSSAFAAVRCQARGNYFSKHGFIILTGFLIVFAFWPELQALGR